MPVVNWRYLLSAVFGLSIRIASLFAIVALLGMFLQMLVVAYPILAPSTLVSSQSMSAPRQYQEGLNRGLAERVERLEFIVSENWQLQGVKGDEWSWVQPSSGLRLEASELPKDWLFADAVGNNKGLVIFANDTLHHFHYLSSDQAGDAPRAGLVQAHPFTGMIRLLVGHPRLPVVAIAGSDNKLQVVDFRDSDALLSIALEQPPDALVWRTTAQLDVLTDGQTSAYEFTTTDIGGAWSRLFTPIQYEGYERPSLLWLPLPAAEEAEPKYSLVPLLFGTLKAALLALIFAIPLSMGAAIYVGFFMSEFQRRRIRPALDMLAAFPTVVLGAIGLFWIAPYFEQIVSSLIGVVIIFPLLLLTSVYLARAFGLRLVNLDALDDWPLTLMPLIIGILIIGSVIGLGITSKLPGNSLYAYLTSLGVSVSYFNSLLVGLVLGVAITPTVFSVAEEAIHAVPKNLASGALALGATPWQGYRDIVLPVALPGIIAAMMIGFGRAAGETMILLMLSGNTGLIEGNVFEGLRSVSASLALELPEAPRDSSHFQVLFVMSILLFGVTFSVNTVAALIRNRIRTRVRGF